MTATATQQAWQGFGGTLWQNEINVRAFLQLNYTPYDGDAAFLAPATARTTKIWETLPQLASADWTAGRLRARTHHRRLSARPALRRRPADRGEEAGEVRARRKAVHRGRHSRPRGARRADPRARGAEDDGQELRRRHR